MKFKLPILENFTNQFVPNLGAVNLLETFLISAVTSLLAIRGYLALTGFPQLGGGDLHIAHMLWGGLLMLAAIIIFISFINSQSKSFATVLGGIGFGAFIDELGKFITSNNDYFYQPTVALIYIIFICLFLFIRRLSSISTYSSGTYLSNAIEGLREIIISDLDNKEQSKALEFLNLCDQNDPLVKMLREIIQKAKAKKENFSVFDAFKTNYSNWYIKVLGLKFITKSIILFFVTSTIFGFLFSFGIFFGSYEYPIADAGLFFSSALVSFFVFRGIYAYRKRRFIDSYSLLLRGSLISIFLSQVFIFIQSEFYALVWLVFYILVYSILKQTISLEVKNLLER